MLQTERDVIRIIKEDKWMMDILYSAQTLQLPDWWVCAGFVRSKIWDTLHGFTNRTPLGDIDVVYFDPEDLDEHTEKRFEGRLQAIHPNLPWSVKNEARMHLVNRIQPYTSAVDAIAKFPETATALGVKLNETNQVVLAAPCGIQDVLRLEVKPNPYFIATKESAMVYERRIREKNWESIWKGLQVQHIIEE